MVAKVSLLKLNFNPGGATKSDACVILVSETRDLPYEIKGLRGMWCAKLFSVCAIFA
jgi:hypothetical protein